jgi:uncharacterized protein YcbK (DUF882 family)
MTFTIPRRLPRTIAAACALVSAAMVLGGWRHAAPPGAGPEEHHTNQVVAVANDHVGSQALVADEALAEPAPAPKAERPAAVHDEPAKEPAAEPAPLAEPAKEPEHFTVEIVNTGKVFEVTLSGPAGEPDEESYLMLRHELRCQRTGAETPIDPRLIELLHQIAVRTKSRIQLVSAFRAPLFPRDLNYHVRGMAADIRVPGLTTAELRDLARSLGANGVGYYPTVQFVHVDVRDTPYFWIDTSGHNEPSKEMPANFAVAEAPAPARSPEPAHVAPIADPVPAEEAPSLLPNVAATATPPARTPAQSAADALGLRPSTQ